jgi:hypothetical protein
MRWTSQASACLLAIVLAGCKGGRDTRSGNESGSMSDTSAMPSSSSDTSGMSGMSRTSADTGQTGGGTSSDTGSQSRMRSDTGTGMRSDSAKANQTKSGVTNSKTGKSTLDPGATKTRPDQGQPVTSKGDTLSRGVDSSTQR